MLRGRTTSLLLLSILVGCVVESTVTGSRQLLQRASTPAPAPAPIGLADLDIARTATGAASRVVAAIGTLDASSIAQDAYTASVNAAIRAQDITFNRASTQFPTANALSASSGIAAAAAAAGFRNSNTTSVSTSLANSTIATAAARNVRTRGSQEARYHAAVASANVARGAFNSVLAATSGSNASTATIEAVFAQANASSMHISESADLGAGETAVAAGGSVGYSVLAALDAFKGNQSGAYESAVLSGIWAQRAAAAANTPGASICSGAATAELVEALVSLTGGSNYEANIDDAITAATELVTMVGDEWMSCNVAAPAEAPAPDASTLVPPPQTSTTTRVPISRPSATAPQTAAAGGR